LLVDLIVHPLLRAKKENAPSAESLMKNIEPLFERITVLVLGPGLGRDPLMQETAALIIKKARSLELPLVIDGDGLFLITHQPNLIKGYKKAVLTPNVMEYKRLWDAILSNNKEKEGDKEDERCLKSLADALGNVTIVRKGTKDIITDGETELICEEQGSNRRCSGQGDILTGAIASFLAWGVIAQKERKVELKEHSATVLAGYGGSMVSRRCNHAAFQIGKRSITTSDMIQQVGPAFQHLFPVDNKL